MSEALNLSYSATQYILHWGQLGDRWGITRSVAQTHALLYLSPEPLHAAQIADTLNLARSNVSAALKELQGWGIVRLAHKIGDRRDHFETMKDVWEMFRVIAEERRKREVDATLEMLRTLQDDVHAGLSDDYTRKRIAEMEEFFEAISALLNDVRSVPTPVLRKMVTTQGKLKKLLLG